MWKNLLFTSPPTTWPAQWWYVGLIGFCWVFGTLLYFLPIAKTWKEQLNPLLWTNAWLGIFLFFFRYQRIPILGMDLFRFLQECAIVIWLAFIFTHQAKHYPKVKLEQRVKEYREQFLPKAK